MAIAEKAPDGVALDYRTPYLEFWGRDPLSEHDAKRDLGELIAKDGDLVDPEFLIVTAPDPLDTRLGYRFDSALDAVQMAVESQGWNLDRSWLPWSPSGQQLSDRAELKAIIDPVSHLRLHDTQPGLMMFRRPRDVDDKRQGQRLLFVMIVGESPTTGVGKVQLRKCLDVILSYHRTRLGELLTRPPRESLLSLFYALLKLNYVEVRIVGPMFSGSHQSMALEMSQWLEKQVKETSMRYRVFVRSGDAEAIAKDKFENDAGGAGRWPTARVQVTFDSTLQHRKLVVQALLEFLKVINGGKSLGKMALLTESDTEFGNTKGWTEGWSELIKGRAGTHTDVTVMKFPFHISQVAAAYNERDRKDDRSTPTLVRPSSRLSIPFDETGSPRDLVPSLSPAMTTATSEFVMAKILETISVEDFRYIGIIATDTRDMIFLAAMIRQYCPDVQLFIPSGDLLLGHPRYVSSLSGTVVATTYPLFSMAQRWDPPYQGDHRRHLFSHQGDQGIYNAALSLLNPKNSEYFESLFDYGMPFDELKDYRLLWRKTGKGFRWGSKESMLPVQTTTEQPSVWLSVIGQRGLWPVAYRDPSAFAEKPIERNFTFRSGYPTKNVESAAFARQFLPIIPQFTWQWGIVFLGLSLTVWLAFWSQMSHTSTPQGPRVWSGWLGMPAPPVTGRQWPTNERRWRGFDHLQRETFVVSGLLALLAVYTYVGVLPSWIAFADSPWPEFLRRELRSLATANDWWNIRFAWLAYYGSHATLLALIATLACRASHWLPSEVKGKRFGGFVRCVFGAAVPVACLAVVVLVIPHTCLPWAASVCQGYLLLPETIGTYDIGEWPSPLIVALLLCTLAASALIIALGRQLEMTWLFVSTALIAVLALPPALSVTLVSRAQWIYEPERFHSLLFFERAVNLGSGVSSFVPVLIVALVGGFWAWCQLRRVTFAERFWGPPLCSPVERVWYQVVGSAISDIFHFLIATFVAVIRFSGNRISAVGRFQSARGGYLRLIPWRKAAREHDSAPATESCLTPNPQRNETHKQEPDTVQEAAGPSPAGPVDEGSANAQTVDQAVSSSDWELYDPKGSRQNVLFGRLRQTAQCVERLVRGWLPAGLLLWPPMLFAEAISAVVLCRLWERAIPGVDFRGHWMTLTMTIFWFLMFSVVVSLGRFVFLWWSISKITREFVTLPMAPAYNRIPPMYARSFGRYLDRVTPSMLNFEIPVRQWAVVAGGLARVEESLRKRFLAQSPVQGRPPLTDENFDQAVLAITRGNPNAKEYVPKGQEAVSTVLAIYHDEVASLQGVKSTASGTVRDESGARSQDDVAWSHTWAGLRNAARACVDVIDPFWADRSAAQAYSDSGAPVSAAAVQSQDVENWVRDAEELIALQVIAYVSQTTVQLKTLAYYLAVAPVLLLMAVGSYPFQPQRFLQVCIWTILFLVVAGVVWVYVRMEKNEFISRVSRTTPNQVTLDRTFLSNILAFVIPLGGVVVAQFPFFSDSLNQWLEPITRVLK